jgi:hypothetical protein
VGLVPAQLALEQDPGVAAVIPLADPAMLFGWSMIWRTKERNRDVTHLIRKLAEMSRVRGWASFRPGRDWLPEPDLDDLTTA